MPIQKASELRVQGKSTRHFALSELHILRTSAQNIVKLLFLRTQFEVTNENEYSKEESKYSDAVIPIPDIPIGINLLVGGQLLKIQTNFRFGKFHFFKSI